MKRFFGIIYWAVMVVAVSLMLKSVMGSFSRALFLSVMLLPGVMFFKFFSGDISFKDRRQGTLHTVYFIIIVMLIEYLCIMFVCWNVYQYPFTADVPPIVMNPVFIWFLLGALLSIETLLQSKLNRSPARRERYVTFTSDRKKVTLELNSITYIESRDYEVTVITATGEAYPTRMKISQWESVLDDRFIRVHRSFIVNRGYITRADSKAVWLGDMPIDISRKYRESVTAVLEKSIG